MNPPKSTLIPLQSLSPASRLIVCERSGQWAAALRIDLADSDVNISECRRLAEAWSALAETNAAFLIAEAARNNVVELVERLSWLRRDLPHVRAAVVADRSLAGYEWFLREAGAIHFLTSPRQLAMLARLAGRHLAGAPSPAQSMAEQIWASLPWARHGT